VTFFGLFELFSLFLARTDAVCVFDFYRITWHPYGSIVSIFANPD